MFPYSLFYIDPVWQARAAKRGEYIAPYWVARRLRSGVKG